MILKTQAKHFDSIQDYILKKGSYEVPEILQVDVSKGNPAYLNWVKAESP